MGVGALSDETRQWTAALVVIGDEILSGRTQDRNVAQVATWLNDQGIRLAEVRVVPDETSRIVAAVNALRASHDYLFTTGGVGPHHPRNSLRARAPGFCGSGRPQPPTLGASLGDFPGSP